MLIRTAEQINDKILFGLPFIEPLFVHSSFRFYAYRSTEQQKISCSSFLCSALRCNVIATDSGETEKPSGIASICYAHSVFDV